MAVLPFSPNYSKIPSCSHSVAIHIFAASLLNSGADPLSNSRTNKRVNSKDCCSKTRVASSHSNPKILKTSRRSRYGQPLSPYDDEEDRGGGSGLDRNGEDDSFSDDEFGEVKISEADRLRLKLRSVTDTRQGNSGRHVDEDLVVQSSPSRTNARGRSTAKNILDNVNKIDKSSSLHTFDNLAAIGYSKDAGSSAKGKFLHLLEELDLDERYFPLLDYLSTFGLKESHFIQMYERHMSSLQINVESAEERLEYLLNVGVKHRDIKKIILRQPQILQYTVENILKPRVAFLNSLGIPESRIGQIITATPSLLSYSVENSLKPTVKYLLEEIGIQEGELSKVVQLSPQILVQRIDVSWNSRLSFLMKELGAPRQSIVKMVTKHPQILHYSIKDGLLPRINFLRSIGMHNSDILKVLTSLTQVFSLSLEANLKPKYMYLINELRNEVRSLTKYPMYLSLSLDQRIRPRHRFLVSLKKAPKGPFPLSSFVPTDECFCQQWAGTSIDEYLDFRQRLLLKDFAKKYQRQ
ncbi:transcription termination factor MTERF9, chloroplastic isoform X1 [Primulina tabacum]|uniref:transcription termination factor MTERF9, chloroplastic isoform X1 n=1 Tax=Primulina tabacum TaxID=48773 RepID=UPI003F5A27C6